MSRLPRARPLPRESRRATLVPCNACRKQTSVKAGTIFASSKLPLRVWFKAIFLVTQSKKGISSIELGRRLGVTHTAAWMTKHQLAQVMLERNASKRLKGAVQMDDAYIGGARPGRRGRGAKGKTPFVAAVATTEDGKPDQIILRPIKAFSLVAIRKLAATALAPDAQVLTDGLACFAAVADVGCTHAAIKTGAGPRAAKTPAFNWVNTALGNIKAALVGTLLIRLVDSVARAVRAKRNIPVRDRRAGGTLESPRPSDDGKRFSGVGSRGQHKQS